MGSPYPKGYQNKHRIDAIIRTASSGSILEQSASKTTLSSAWTLTPVRCKKRKKAYLVFRDTFEPFDYAAATGT